MTKRLRRWRAAKVIGLLICILLLVLWIVSFKYSISYRPILGPRTLAIDRGRVILVHLPYSIPGLWFRDYFFSARDELGFCLPRWDLNNVQIPIWLLLVAAGFPTGILWWRDRRPMAGYCSACSYNLTGNESGTCPECGTPIEAVDPPNH